MQWAWLTGSIHLVEVASEFVAGVGTAAAASSGAVFPTAAITIRSVFLSAAMLLVFAVSRPFCASSTRRSDKSRAIWNRRFLIVAIISVAFDRRGEMTNGDIIQARTRLALLLATRLFRDRAVETRLQNVLRSHDLLAEETCQCRNQSNREGYGDGVDNASVNISKDTSVVELNGTERDSVQKACTKLLDFGFSRGFQLGLNWHTIFPFCRNR